MKWAAGEGDEHTHDGEPSSHRFGYIEHAHLRQPYQHHPDCRRWCPPGTCTCREE